MLFTRSSRLAAPLLLGLCASLCLTPALRAGGKAAGGAESLFEEGKFSRAHAAYAAAARSDSRNAAVRVNLVRSSLRQDKWLDAVAEGRSAVAAMPQNADVHGILSLALMRAGSPQRAEDEAKKSLALNPNSYWGLVAKGRSLMFNEKDGEAHELLRKAADLNPGLPEAFYYLRETFDEKTTFEEKEKLYKAFLKTKAKGFPMQDMADALSHGLPKKEVEEKKKVLAFEAFGDIDQKKMKDADEGKIKPVVIRIPFERYKQDNETILLPMTINGVSMKLLYDTGAGHSVTVCGPAAERLNLPTLYKTYMRGVSGKEVISVCRADEMKIGPQTFKNIPVEATPNPIAPEFDGLLGGAVFDDYAVTIDYESNTMVLTRGKTAAAPKPEEGNHITTIPFHNMHGYIIVPLKLEDRSEVEWAMLDTGAGGMGVLSYITALDLAKKRHEDEKFQTHIDRRMGVGTSNTGFDAMLFRFSVDLGLQHNGGTPYFMEMDPIMGASMMDTQVSPGFDFQLIGLVGISYVAEAKRVTFDYPHHLMTLEFGPKTAN